MLSSLQAQVTLTSLLPDGAVLHGRVLRRRELADGWEVALRFTPTAPDAAPDIRRLLDEAMTTTS
ncbi:MAG: hypothetical protein ACTHQ3_06505 [Motilibacteraceae bacterium]